MPHVLGGDQVSGELAELAVCIAGRSGHGPDSGKRIFGRGLHAQ